MGEGDIPVIYFHDDYAPNDQSSPSGNLPTTTGSEFAVTTTAGSELAATTTAGSEVAATTTAGSEVAATTASASNWPNSSPTVDYSPSTKPSIFSFGQVTQQDEIVTAVPVTEREEVEIRQGMLKIMRFYMMIGLCMSKNIISLSVRLPLSGMQ